MADNLTTSEKLVELYEQAQRRLTDIIRTKATRGSPAVYERRILRQVNAVLRKLKEDAPEVVRQLVMEEYQKGLDSFLDDLTKSGISEFPQVSPFSRLNTRNITLLSDNIIDDFTKAVHLVGRHMSDQIRQAGLAATASKEATGGTVKTMQKELEKRLLGIGDVHRPNGRIGVKYKNDVIMPLDKYSQMVARTTPAEAQNKAKSAQGIELGYDLVRMTSHTVTCEVCAKYQGRVYALTKEAANGKYKGPNGEALRFPYLYDTAFHHGYETIHPNCRHRLAILPAQAYTPAELAKFSRESMRPFLDSRSDDARKAYAAEQAEKRERNEDKKQWLRYKARLGEDAPRSLSGFRTMKRANSEKFQKVQIDYKRRSTLSANPDLALPNAENVFAESKKFTNYFFGGTNKNGLSKGVAFTSRLGYNIDNWQEFQDEIVLRAAFNPAIFEKETEHGKYYQQPMVIYGRKDNPMDIMISWEVKNGETRFVTAFPNSKGGK